jgi:hypothetical protein
VRFTLFAAPPYPTVILKVLRPDSPELDYLYAAAGEADTSLKPSYSARVA